MELRSSFLVQRLKLPYPEDKRDFGQRADQAFGGGGLQLSKDAWQLLYQYCRIDYMGAAEYEFGAFPQSFLELSQQTDLVTFSFVIPKEDIPKSWFWESAEKVRRRKELADAKAFGKKPPRVKKKGVVDDGRRDRTVYVICREAYKRLVQQRILDIAQGKERAKEGAQFDLALHPHEEYVKELAGWFEMSNGFFFFLDETMWKGFWTILRPKEQL